MNKKRKFTLISFGVAGFSLLAVCTLFYLGLRFPTAEGLDLRWLAWTLQILFVGGTVAGIVSLLIKKEVRERILAYKIVLVEGWYYGRIY